MKKAGILLTLFLFLTAVSSPNPPSKPTPIKIRAKSITSFEPNDPSRGRFGALVFRGGLVLSSSYAHFGGISALRLEPDGAHFIALSDNGFWLRGRIVYNGNRPAAIEDAVMAPVLDFRGKSAVPWDTESIAADDGILYVGIERKDYIVRFNYAQKGLLARAEPVAVPAGVKSLPSNRGLEGMVFVPRNLPLGGTLIAFSEQGLDATGNLKAFLVGGPTPGSFAIRRTQKFDISDAALLPGGEILVLERKFFLLEGVSIRIRRLRLTDIRPGAVVDGPTLFEADGRCEIDNMEAISVHRAKSGEIVLTLMSDNNNSIIQRTLLLQFALIQ